MGQEGADTAKAAAVAAMGSFPDENPNIPIMASHGTAPSNTPDRRSKPLSGT